MVSDELELETLAYWNTNKIFEKSLEQNKEKELFTFYDGPPYATGKPHYGHMLQSAIKDTILRYKTMRGYYAPRRVGWDTHGLPIENIVEKEMGIASKRDIEADIEGFNNKCKETMYRYVDIFRETLQRLGRWADYGNEYSTMDRDYMESEWWVFSQLWKKDLIYKAFRSSPYCIRCATPLSNFEVSDSYRDVKDMSVYVALPLRGGVSNARLLIWTTTPWTLPANVAVAYNPELSYVAVRHGEDEYILATERVASVLGEDATVVRTVSSEELQSMTYEPMYASTLSDTEQEKSFCLVPSDHVTAEDGTGLVHMAPAFGEEDYRIAKQSELPILRTVSTVGNFLDDVPIWGGRNIFEAQKDIMKDLDMRGFLFKRELIEHSYPFCWRCDTPLIYFALDSWFLNIANIKDQMLRSNEEISWVPEHVKHGRFAKGIESAPDWSISRNRFWSVPMPVWECDVCEARTCIGSVQELQDISGASDEQVQDLHRPYVDDITWTHDGCTGTMNRILEVLDVWFDSASMPYAQWHYPFANKELVERGYPADFIAESIEMTRQWFYVLHVLATALTQEDIGLGKNKPAFLNAIASGLIFAEDGRKLSKKLKNYPEIEPTLKQYGADVLRFYLLSSTSLGEPYRFSEKDMRQIQRNVYMTLWNVYSMYTRYAKVHEYTFPEERYTYSNNRLDVWIINRTKQLVSDVTKQTDAYRIDAAARLFIAYVDDLSNWYVRRSRGRLQHPKDKQERDEVFGTMHTVLATLARLLAPFMPFVSEQIYRNLTNEQSVHLVAWPEETPVDQNVLERMQAVRDAVSEGLALRAQANIKVRQALQSFTVAGTDFDTEDMKMIREEVNVKEVILADSFALDTEITEELKQEGIARDLIRYGQSLRKQAGYALDDRIEVAIVTDAEDVIQALTAHRDIVADALQANIVNELESADAREEVVVNGVLVSIAVKIQK